MTTYTILKQLESFNLLDLSIRNGIISSVYLDYMEIYEMFLNLREKGEYKMQCYYFISSHFCISVDNVRKIVARMS